MLSRVICFEHKDHYKPGLAQSTGRDRVPVIDLPQTESNWDEGQKKDFLKAYVDLVGQLSVRNHSLLWWATDIASKNRFLSPLALPLEQLFKVIYLMKDAGDDTLVFTGVSWYLEKTLRLALNARGVEFSWHGDRLGPYWKSLKECFLVGLRVLRHLFFILPRMMSARRVFKNSLSESMGDPTPVYVVKTFVEARAIDKGKYKDLFFGPLIEFLSAKHRVVILADGMDHFDQMATLMKGPGRLRIFPWEAFLRVPDMVSASTRILGYRVQCPQQLDFEGYNVSDLVIRVCHHGGNKIQALQLYQYFAMCRFLKSFTVQNFAYFCEFNPCEKLSLLAVKEFSKATRTFGYQHTVVPQSSANMFSSKFEEGILPRPDHLLIAGQKPKEIIHRYETRVPPSEIEVSCALRFEHLFSRPQSPRGHRGHILLALEGMPQVAEITNYVLDAWRHPDGYKLRIRAHSRLPLDKFAGRLKSNPYQMPGVEVSKGTSLNEDLLWADIVIYWGSAVALEAVSMGKPVIHYDTGAFLSYDPLFELKDFKWVARRALPLIPIIQEIYALPQGAYDAQRRSAQAYISAYFYPVTEQALNCFDPKS